MPTAAELDIVVRAQDEASARLRQVATEVQTLSQRVEQAGAGFGGSLTRGITAVADAMRIVEGVAQVAGRAIGGVADQIRAGFGSNIELQRATVAFQRYTGSAEQAAAIIATLRREAAVSPFNDQEIISAGRALIGFAQGSTEQLLELVRVAEQLAVLDPTQGIVGGVRALQEAMAGQFESLIDRFEIPRNLIERLRTEGVPNLEIVRRALEFRGIDAGAIEAYGRSFEGLLSTIQSFAQELRQLATAGLFDALGQAFAHVVAVINQYGDQLRVIAAGIGEVFSRVATSVARSLAPLLGVLDQLLPGFREFVTAEFDRPVEGLADAAGGMERFQTAAAQTAAPMAALNRELGEIGVKAAELQIGADRIRRGFEDQIRPLQRQLDLLQNSADVQRVQNQLAANRALTERLQLTREIAALEAAGAGADPNAPDLTPRQQAIALALQERRLRLEQLGLDQQRAPAIQELQNRIAELRRREQDALDPSERLLESYRDRVAVVQTEIQRQQNLKTELEATTKAIQDQQRQAAAGPDDAAHQKALEDARKRGREAADAWLKSYEAWVDENGGSLWNAVVASFNKWYAAGGKEALGKVGALIWGAVLAGITAGPTVEDLINEQIGRANKRLTDWLNEMGQRLFPGLPGPAGPGNPPWPGAGTPLPIGGTPRPLAPVVPPVGGEAGPPVNVGDVTVTVEGVPDASLAERLKQGLTEWLRLFIAAQAATDPGLTPGLPGAGR